MTRSPLLDRLREEIPAQPSGTCAHCFIYKKLAAAKALNAEAADMMERLMNEREKNESEDAGKESK